MTYEYRAPQGRPRSVPPLSNGSVELDYSSPKPMDLEGAIAAYQAGVPTKEIYAKAKVRRGRTHSELYDELVRRGIPLRRGRYKGGKVVLVKASNVEPVEPRPVREPLESPQHYGMRVQQWMLRTQPGYAAVQKATRRAVAYRRVLQRLRKKMEEERAVRSVSPPPPVIEFVAAAKEIPLTRWQRFCRWFGF